jgi:hypothetical protein
MAKRGRPNIYDPLELAERLNEYINNNDYPLIKEFCLQPNTPCHDRLIILKQDCPELDEAYKKAIAKQEVFIDRGATMGVLNPTFAIFKLKQHQFGWTDKQQIDAHLSGELEINVTVTDD